MKTAGDFSPMNPGEGDTRAFDFVDDLAPGQSISGAPTFTMAVASGDDPNAQDHVGAISLVGTLATVDISSLLPGVDYTLAASVPTTNPTGVLVLWAFQPCLPIGVPLNNGTFSR